MRLLALTLLVLSLLAGVANASPAQALTDETAVWLTEQLDAPVETRTLVETPLDGYVAAQVWCTDSRIEIRREWLVELWRIGTHRRVGNVYDGMGAHVLIHELLHHMSAPRCVLDVPLEEGVVDAVALDMLAAWGQRFVGVPLVSDPVYDEARSVRAASEWATRSPWRSRASRLWRRELLVASHTDRRVMMSAAEHARDEARGGRTWLRPPRTDATPPGSGASSRRRTPTRS